MAPESTHLSVAEGPDAQCGQNKGLDFTRLYKLYKSLLEKNHLIFSYLDLLFNGYVNFKYFDISRVSTCMFVMEMQLMA